MIQEYQKKYEKARSEYSRELERMIRRDELYGGTKEVRKDINSGGGISSKKASNVRNIIFEFIESQIDSNVPQPKVEAKHEGDEELAQLIEDVLRDDINRIHFEDINDLNERTTPIQGMDFFEVYYDSSIKGLKFSGDINVRSIHPSCFIPQPKVTDIDRMDYFFLTFEVTKDYVLKRHGKEVHERIFTSDDVEEMVTEVVCYYRNAQGNVGRYIYIEDVECENLDDYYSRYLEHCVKCGQVKTSEKCECGSKKFERKQHGEETKNFVDGTGVPQEITIPIYIPKEYPIVMRKNIPIAKRFAGQSDIDVIEDQQDSMNKIRTKIQRKLMGSGSIVEISKESLNQIDFMDKEINIVVANKSDPASVRGVYNITSDISKEMMYEREQFDSAQSTLGINNSFQGKADSTANSGYAKELQIQQASGRLQSKRSNKYSAYKRLFELMFKFKLAFTDGSREVATYKGNQKVYKSFNKDMFLIADEAGEYHYNDDFMFSVDYTGGVMNDRQYMWKQVKEDYASGLYGDTTNLTSLLKVWQLLETLHYPMSKDIRSQIESDIEQQAMQPIPTEEQ